MLRGRLFAILPLLVFLAVAAYFLAGLWGSANQGSRFIPSAMVNRDVPAFDLPSFREDFPGLAKADLKGKIQVVNFFASWCVPCLAEHPLITELSKRDDIVINGIAYSDKPANVEKWLNKHGNPYARVGVDLGRRIGIDWGVTGVPETYIVNAEGLIVYKHGGPLRPDVIQDEILPLIKELSK